MKKKIATALITVLTTTSAFADTIMFGDIKKHEELMIIKENISCRASSLSKVGSKFDPQTIVNAEYKIATEANGSFSISGTVDHLSFNINGDAKNGSASVTLKNELDLQDGQASKDYTTVDGYFRTETSSVHLTSMKADKAYTIGCTRFNREAKPAAAKE